MASVRSMADPADLNLDELKRRGRRRLIGAIVLALVAAVVVPMLLESDPKPLGEDVSVKIPPVDDGKFVNRLNEKAKREPPKALAKAEKAEQPAPAEPPRAEAPKEEPSPKADTPKSETPKSETPKTETRIETAKEEPRKSEPPPAPPASAVAKTEPVRETPKTKDAGEFSVQV